MTSASALPLFHTTANATINHATGAFSFPDFNAAVLAQEVAINLTHGGQPLYRSKRISYSRAQQGNLNIYVLQPVLPPSDGVSAGAISKALGSASLPGNTTLTSNPWGIGVAGSQSGADIQFGISLVANRSTNLAVFLEMVLHNWNIHVGFPADWCKSADGSLSRLQVWMRRH